MCGRNGLDQDEWALASYHPEPVPKDGVDTLYEFCRNLVVWDSQMSRMIFAHLSVQEYIEKNIFTAINANSIPAKSCLQFLNHLHQWRFNFFPPFALYSILNWTYQVELSYDRDIGEELLGILQTFIGISTRPGKLYVQWAAIAITILRHSF